MTKLSEQRAWAWTTGLGDNQRIAQANEFQAYYLSRIDRHLERIADLLESGALAPQPGPGSQPPKTPRQPSPRPK